MWPLLAPLANPLRAMVDVVPVVWWMLAVTKVGGRWAKLPTIFGYLGTGTLYTNDSNS
jgi:hypothetical protein